MPSPAIFWPRQTGEKDTALISHSVNPRRGWIVGRWIQDKSTGLTFDVHHFLRGRGFLHLIKLSHLRG